jgi:dihydroorotate dehydrogenase electron transfer subunit
MLKDPQALIVRKKSWDDYVLLAMRSPRIAAGAKPGQFLMIRVSDQTSLLLRRPFSIHSREGGAVEVFFARAGAGTAILAEKNPGETLDILGPLGNGFRTGKKSRRPSGDRNTKGRESGGEFKGRTVYLIGGGRGIAPLYFLALELRGEGARPRIFYGGRTESDLPLIEQFSARKFDLFISTDDGSLGFRGLVTSMLERELKRVFSEVRPSAPSRRTGTSASPAPPDVSRPAQIFACGPDPMMEKIAALAADFRIPAQFSLESIMGCGIGACWGCVRKIRRGAGPEWVKVCEDGPVFAGPEIIWQD